MLDIHEHVEHIHASLTTLLMVLAQKGVIDMNDLADLKEEVIKEPRYKTVFDNIKSQRAEIEKLENSDLGDIFASFFGGTKKD